MEKEDNTAIEVVEVGSPHKNAKKVTSPKKKAKKADPTPAPKKAKGSQPCSPKDPWVKEAGVSETQTALKFFSKQAKR